MEALGAERTLDLTRVRYGGHDGPVTGRDREEIEGILVRVRDEILEEMRTVGFYWKAEKRFDATEWDVNNGLCEEFGEAALAALPSEIRAQAWCTWLEEFGAPNHYALVVAGRFYDAECIEGVEDARELPFYLGKKRPEVAAEMSSV